MAFCKEYNAATAKMGGEVIPVEITVYEVRAAHMGMDGQSMVAAAAAPAQGGCML